MGLYSRNRGKRGERLWCAFCREQGYDVHRTAQYRGNTGAAGGRRRAARLHALHDAYVTEKARGEGQA